MRYASLPVERLTSWAHFNDIQINGATITSNSKDEAGNDKGGGIFATQNHESGDILLTVPADLVLSPAKIDEQARSDKHLRELLEAVGPSFSLDPRKKTLVFLLLQLTHSGPEFQNDIIGTSSPFTDYVQCLPKAIPLPTFMPEDRIDLLIGTSLFDALAQKLTKLEQEFEHLRTTTESIPWCQRFWWDEETGSLEFQDWKLADAMYRSRAVQLPQVAGNAMVPVLDMANHAPQSDWNARFEADADGNALLVVRDDKKIVQGQEITIMYGAGGACEMLFSYGFLDEEMVVAREIFLSVTMPDDDPLALAKVQFSQQAPGIRVFQDAGDSVRWDSPYIWWACVNEEDGLSFDVVQTNDGDRELQARWKEANLSRSDDIGALLQDDPRADIFRLRATVLVQQRVELQGQDLLSSQEGVDEQLGSHEASQLKHDLKWIRQLREVEMSTLTACYQWLDNEKTRLMGTDTVRALLASGETFHPNDSATDEDFS